MRSTPNQKYEITDIAHESYPFLHRIRAKKDIGSQVKAGDPGGFVEGGSNLSSEPGDDAWLFDDAIAAGGAYVDQGSCLRGNAVACDSAYVSRGSVLSGNARVEDNAYLRGAVMTGDTLGVRASPNSSRRRTSGGHRCFPGIAMCTVTCGEMFGSPVPLSFCRGRRSATTRGIPLS